MQRKGLSKDYGEYGKKSKRATREPRRLVSYRGSVRVDTESKRSGRGRETELVTTSVVSCERRVFNTRSDGENNRDHAHTDKIRKRSARDGGLCDEVGRRELAAES